jgi:hypothetical protein
MVMRKLYLVAPALALATLAAAGPAAACGFLVAENGAVSLQKSTTLVAYVDGIEHYITNFTFASDQPTFGSIIPLPGRPTDVKRAGDWTLQRLVREVAPPVEFEAAGDAATAGGPGDVEVVLQTTIDSLDVTVLKGGGPDVLQWARDNGFTLPDDAETRSLLTYYSDRSPYFVAAKFDATKALADGFANGDGIPIQITIPVERPWVPLHILGFKKFETDLVIADVFLLTPHEPDLLHGVGTRVLQSRPAGDLLLDDLRSDTDMGWIPNDAWFSYLQVEAEARDVTYDLSIGTDGEQPSFVEAGLMRHEPTPNELRTFGLERFSKDPAMWPFVVAGIGVALVSAATMALVLRRARRSGV